MWRTSRIRWMGFAAGWELWRISIFMPSSFKLNSANPAGELEKDALSPHTNPCAPAFMAQMRKATALFAQAQQSLNPPPARTQLHKTDPQLRYISCWRTCKQKILGKPVFAVLLLVILKLRHKIVLKICYFCVFEILLRLQDTLSFNLRLNISSYLKSDATKT
jgi:hypothetical protein